jgi:L-threonylcarbamoyladenylate synthase
MPGKADRLKTLIVKIEPDSVPDDIIRTVADVLLRDGVMAYPTETFYGLGAVCFSGKAVRRIYRLKARDAGKPLSLIVSGLDMIETLVVGPPPLFHRLVSEFWPGPLTLVLKASPSFPARLAGTGHTIGVRIPSVPWLRRLVHEVGIPITATRATISGEGEISDSAEILRIFNDKVDIIVDGGPTRGGQVSTIVDITGRTPLILREGAIPKAQLEKYL